MPVATALLPVLLLACRSEPPPPQVAPIEAGEVAAAAAGVLCRSATTDCQAEGPVARLAGHELSFSATVTNFNALPPRTIGMGTAKQDIPGEVQLAADFGLSMDGRPLLAGSVSHAASDADLEAARAQALDEAAQRFVIGHALGLVDALRGQPEAPTLGNTGLAVESQLLADGAWRGWASYPVLRGQGLDPDLVRKMAPQVGSVVRAVAPFLEGRDAELHTIKVQARLGGGGTSPCGIVPPVMPVDGATVSLVPLTGSVMVDGLALPDGEQPAICALAEAVAWPLPRSGSRLEWTQVVVVRPEAGAGEGGAAEE